MSDTYADDDQDMDGSGADYGQDPAPQTAPATGDGLPGVPIPQDPDWRAGAFGSGRGILGMIKISNPGKAGPSHGAVSGGGGSSDLPQGYMYDAQGKLQVTPGFAQTHPTVLKPFWQPQTPEERANWAKAGHNIDWGGVLKDLGVIITGAVTGAGWGEAAGLGAAGTGALPNAAKLGGSLAGLGFKTVANQDDANKKQPDGAKRRGQDRVTNGLP